MEIYFTNDYFSDDYYLMVLEDIQDRIFIKKYPFFKSQLKLSKTLDFKLKIYGEDIMREVAFKPLSL